MLRAIGAVTSLVFLMVACGGGSGGAVGGGTGGAISAPSGLQYGGNTVGDVGTPYGPLQPIVTGAVSGYSVSPALPAGLSLDPNTGVISGTPLTAAKTTYTITASNEAGAATIALNLVVLVPPTALTYASPATGTVGAALTELVPTFSGDADNFAILPALPTSLRLDPTTGVVSGTPTSARVPATYTITASNLGGSSTTFDLLLAVDPPPAGTVATGVFRDSTVIGLGYVSGAHSGLTDASGAFTYETGQGITFSVGQVNIGTVPTAKALITPIDLVAHGTGTSNHVLNVVRFLMLLDQDNDPSNGVQISTAVTAAAASWGPVDFDAADLPTVLGPLIQLASTADGVTHVLPDAATAQARLRTDFYCTYAGRYDGTYAGTSAPGDHGTFTAEVFPDGRMHASANGTAALAGFDVVTANALNPLLDATFALDSQSPNIGLQGSFPDSTYLSGSYLADTAGTFEAVGNMDNTPAYKFVGTYTSTMSTYTGFISFRMDDSNQVSGSALLGPSSLAGTVSGNAFTGTVSYFVPYQHHFTTRTFSVSGTYSNTASGVTLGGRYSTIDGSVVTFSTVGCRAN